MTSFFIFAGELSGDLHGGHLISALKERLPAIHISGVAGPHMRQHGISVLLPMEEFAVMGFTDVIKSFPKLWSQFFHVRRDILKNNYDVVILIDYPGFNLRLAKSLRKAGFKGKIIQYICPSVWAHGLGRIAHMASTLDLLLTIYPFEADYFRATSLPVAYVGNPLQEYKNRQVLNANWRCAANIGLTNDFVAIFPGSRRGEIERNLPLHLAAASSLKKAFPATHFAISCAHPEMTALLAQALKTVENLTLNQDVWVVPKQYTYEMMAECRSAIAKSGTVTLELAIRQCPTVVTYLLTPLNRFIAKHILRVNLAYYCIVNILGKKAIFPEYIETRLPLQAICNHLHALHSEGHFRQVCLENCQKIQSLLGAEPSSVRAAKAIMELLHV